MILSLIYKILSFSSVFNDIKSLVVFFNTISVILLFKRFNNLSSKINLIFLLLGCTLISIKLGFTSINITKEGNFPFGIKVDIDFSIIFLIFSSKIYLPLTNKY